MLTITLTVTGYFFFLLFLFPVLFLRRLLILLLLLLLRLDIGRVPAAQAAVRVAAHTAAARSATVLRTAIELTTAPPHR